MKNTSQRCMRFRAEAMPTYALADAPHDSAPASRSCGLNAVGEFGRTGFSPPPVQGAA